jgi:putative membrane protein
LCGGYGFLVSFIYHFQPWTGLYKAVTTGSEVIPNVFLTLNILLSLLLVFRTNAANERFWEGRTLLGALVNTVRNLARGIWIVVEEREPKDREEKEAALRLVVAFSIAMKLHLRSEPMNEELVPLMSSLQYFKLQEMDHPPLEIAFWIGDYLQNQYDHKCVNIFQVTALHKLLDELVDILGGCERILKTPMPLLYTIILKALLVIYFLVLPFALVIGLTWWTGPILAFISLILLSIDEVGSEIEEPFGHDPNDLPLDLICATILRNVEELITVAPCTRFYCDFPNNVES